MKLGSLKSNVSLDGELCVVSRDLKTAVKVPQISANLREAMEKWGEKESALQKVYNELNEGKASGAFAVKEEEFHSALPRTWLFADGSAFIYHIKLVRMARKAALPETLTTVPLMYQGECGQFLAPTEDIPQRDPAHGTDFEGEVGVITDFVPMGVTPEQALKHIKLFVLINDVSLRGLIPEELAGGFGFFQSKPASALSPFAVTADELGSSFKDGRVQLPLQVSYNGNFFGKANAGAMHFHFGQLISHAAKTRNLAAGSLIGSGTVSNEDHAMGSSCLAEVRMIETIETGAAKTPFMKAGDTVEMKMFNEKGENVFGRIMQKVKSVQ
ncbi:fumarylacetoacetate hydrolase family protein [Bdellovibrio svalbardensis]|uniref:Fumarylacetoacetate hydrolase family protein n=1 Tax=Bdellovibrio svalbardensis TaxID=2972972 RepID=A0ABT6DKB7_9BACT|nr:fumarylacetoacetate hydrolase family protein [Bdellovibrio svalbardensis]MDG0817258.1 fumarylacetoacetate hydrolase family protein [Bdellovibrio svalbardensis]